MVGIFDFYQFRFDKLFAHALPSTEQYIFELLFEVHNKYFVEEPVAAVVTNN